MAKIVLCLAVAMMVLTYVSAAERKCFVCNPCEDIADETSVKCAADQPGCYIKGNPETEKWDRGCAKSKADACGTDEDTCSYCDDEDECNSGSFVTGSIVLSVGMVAMVNMMR